MMTQTIDSKESGAIRDFLRLIKEQQVEIVITENGNPVAKVIPVDMPSRKHLTGLHRGAMIMRDDFDEPLSDEFWLGDE